jgi:hypothetical protein
MKSALGEVKLFVKKDDLCIEKIKERIEKGR